MQDLGADGVIAVSQGAGGHAGPITPLVLILWLKSEFDIAIIAGRRNFPWRGDGGVSRAWGGCAVSVGTRFIACKEAGVDAAYKNAVVNATAEDIVLTSRISGTPAAVIRTPFIEKMGTELPWIVRQLKDNPRTKKFTVPLIHLLGMRALEDAAYKQTRKPCGAPVNQWGLSTTF